MKSFKLFYAFIFLLAIIFLFGCKGDYKLPYPQEGGTVLGKEICQHNSSTDFWLINFDKNYGDTLTYKGVLYNHVVKTNQLDPLLRRTGMRGHWGLIFYPIRLSHPDVQSYLQKHIF